MSSHCSEDYFAELYQRHHEQLLGFLERRTDPELAEELAQDVWVTVWEHTDEVHKFREWLYTLGANRLRNNFKRVSDQVGLTEEYDREDESQKEPVTTMMECEELREVWEFVELLPNKQRDAIICRYVHGMTLTTIASVLDIRLEAVEQRRQNAIVNLRCCLITKSNPIFDLSP